MTNKWSWELTIAILSSTTLCVVAGNESHTGLLNSNLLSCWGDVAYGNEIINSARGSCICFGKWNCLDIISTYRFWTRGSNTFILLLTGRKKSLDVCCNDDLLWKSQVANTKQLKTCDTLQKKDEQQQCRYQIWHRWEMKQRKRRPLKFTSTTGWSICLLSHIKTPLTELSCQSWSWEQGRVM